MRKIDYFDLGGTLYVPIINENISAILRREKYPFLKSVVICLEDSILDSDLSRGMNILENIFQTYEVTDLKVFVRARNIDNLNDILTLENIHLLDGFVLPKFDLSNASEYLSIFLTENHFYIMPILETSSVFNPMHLHQISETLEPFKERILSIRIGAEDILSKLEIMRNCQKTLYEIMPLYITISTIINTFKPKGFNISSTVFPCFESAEYLKKELQSDIEHQLINKTSIHPSQIETIHNSYKVTHDEYIIATKLLDEEVAIFNYHNKMYEKVTHLNWARTILKRYKSFGMIERVCNAQ